MESLSFLTTFNINNLLFLVFEFGAHFPPHYRLISLRMLVKILRLPHYSGISPSPDWSSWPCSSRYAILDVSWRGDPPRTNSTGISNISSSTTQHYTAIAVLSARSEIFFNRDRSPLVVKRGSFGTSESGFPIRCFSATLLKTLFKEYLGW